MAALSEQMHVLHHCPQLFARLRHTIAFMMVDMASWHRGIVAALIQHINMLGLSTIA